MFSLVYTVYFHKQPPEYRCSVKKGVLKNFVNFIGKHLCWSSFLIKLQAWHLFWRKFANGCLCTELTPLSSVLPAVSLYIQHLLPHHHFYYCSYLRCLFSVQIQKASKNLNLVSHFTEVTFISVSFFFHVFSVFLSFVSFFLVAAHENWLKSFCLHWRH